MHPAPVCLSLRQPSWQEEMGSFKPDRIVHLGGKADEGGSKAEIWAANMNTTLELTEEAVRQGVKRFIFVSSIKVLGDTSGEENRFHPDSHPSPQGPYAASKWAAEQWIRDLGLKGIMEVVILRPPLVYGPGVKGNFQNLLALVERRIPLPLAALDKNRRSFISVSNLVDLILLCLEHPLAANQTFHASDDEDVSPAELLRRLGKALNKPPRSFPLSKNLLKMGLRVLGKGELFTKLCGNLRVDISKTKQLLGWSPRTSMEDELKRIATWWKTRNQKGD